MKITIDGKDIRELAEYLAEENWGHEYATAKLFQAWIKDFFDFKGSKIK